MARREEAMAAAKDKKAKALPVGSPLTLPIRESDVQITEGAAVAPIYSEDAAATLVWNNYQRAKNYIENNDWLLEWQETDILYQSPIPNRQRRVENGRPPRVPRFLVAKFTRTLARAVKKALFQDQVPFFLRPTSKTSQEQVDAWTHLISLLLKRMKLKYHGGLQINCQTLQGTGLGKYGWEERKIVKRGRRRKSQPANVTMPSGETKEIPTEKSDEFEKYSETITESWPFYEYRRLGTTLFDPKWCTPDMPEESAGYCVDVDYVNFEDLQRLAELSCYKKTANSPGIPPIEDLKQYFFDNPSGDAPVGTNVESTMTAQGSMVVHAEGRNKQTDISPLARPILLLEEWDERTVKTVLVFNDRKLTIRNEEHEQGSMSHTSCTWWPIDNCGYGMGIGKIEGPDQRINQGVINEALKMIAYPFNAPILTARGENAPTQNVIAALGKFWQVDLAGTGDVNKAIGFMKMPEVPADAWRFLDLSQRGGEQVSGADAQMQQGALNGKQGATRSSFGSQRVAQASDQNIADPVDSFADGVIIPVVNFLVHMVRTKMPLKEIRQILSEKYASIIESAIKEEQFLSAEFEVEVLAGQKLAAKAAIQQLLPFFMQIVQQPQLLEQLHMRGETVDFSVIMDLLLQVSELAQQPDVFRALTPRERIMLKQMNAGVQKVQGAVALEKVKGQNRLQEINHKGENDLANTAAKIALEHEANGTPLIRATGLFERSADAGILRNGLENPLEA